MCYEVLGHVPLGGALRRYDDSQLEVEVGAGGSFVPSWVGHGFLSRIKSLSGTVLDYGCGSGVLGLHAAVQNSVERVIFVDICDKALALSKSNVQRNTLGKGLMEKSEFITPEVLTERYLGAVEAAIVNLPENPSLDYCGEDGSGLQRKILLESLPGLLRADGQIITKQVSYAARWSEEPATTARYEVKRLGAETGSAPKELGGESAEAKYFQLRQRG